MLAGLTGLTVAGGRGRRPEEKHESLGGFREAPFFSWLPLRTTLRFREGVSLGRILTPEILRLPAATRSQLPQALPSSTLAVAPVRQLARDPENSGRVGPS
jgi:hypothetical protein